MSIKDTAIRVAAALIAASAPAIALAQAPAGAPPPRALSPELEALNPPVPADLVLSEDRRVPAEKKAAAYNDRKWTAPKTSWGHPSLRAPGRPTTCAAFLSTARRRSARKSS